MPDGGRRGGIIAPKSLRACLMNNKKKEEIEMSRHLFRFIRVESVPLRGHVQMKSTKVSVFLIPSLPHRHFGMLHSSKSTQLPSLLSNFG